SQTGSKEKTVKDLPVTIDWAQYYRSHGYQTYANGGTSRVQFAPVFVSPMMQWGVPSGSLNGPYAGSPYSPLGAFPGMLPSWYQPAEPTNEFTVNQTTTGSVEADRLRQLAENWGSLPARDQQKLLAELTHKLSPKHREAVVMYFKQLT